MSGTNVTTTGTEATPVPPDSADRSRRGRGGGHGRAWCHSTYQRRSASDSRIQNVCGQSARDSRHRRFGLLGLQRDLSELPLLAQRRCEERLAPAQALLIVVYLTGAALALSAAPARHRSHSGIGDQGR